MDRNDVTQVDMKSLVFLQVDAFMVEGDSFTAHDVTRALRADNPSLEIDHQVVRTEVRALLNSGEMPGYECAPDATLPGRPLRYTPSDDGVIVKVDGL